MSWVGGRARGGCRERGAWRRLGPCATVGPSPRRPPTTPSPLPVPENPDALPTRFDATPGEIAERLRRARRAGHPMYVWDDLPVAAWTVGVRAVERAVTQVLLGAERAVLDPAEEASTRAIGVAAFTSGTAPLLGHWIDAGRLDARAEVASLLADHLAHARARAARTRALLDRLAGAFDARGLRPVLLKGVHGALRWFPEPGTRPMSDVDLWIPAARAPDIESALREAGFRVAIRQRRLMRSVWVPRGDPERLRSLDVTHARNPLSLDLHLSLERDFDGAVRAAVPDPEDEDLEPIPGLSATYRGLRGPLLAFTLALHASEDLDHLQLIRLVELVLVSRAVSPMEDLWRETRERAAPWGGLGLVFPALALTHRLAPDAVPEDVVSASRAAAPSALRALVDRLTPGTAQRLVGIRFADRLAAAPDARAKLRRILHMLFPPSTGGSLRGLARIYVTRALQLLRGRVGIRSDVPRHR